MEDLNQEPILAEIVENGLQKVRSELTPEENKALNTFLKNKDQGGSITKALAPKLQEELFRLYSNGTAISEIARLNPNISLGQICHAAVENDWKGAIVRYQEAAKDRMASRLPQIMAESVEYIADMITATHRLNGDAIKKYLQTGDEDHLKGVQLGNFKSYKELIEALAKISGLGNNGNGKQPQVAVQINNNQGDAPQIDGASSLAALVAKKKG